MKHGKGENKDNKQQPADSPMVEQSVEKGRDEEMEQLRKQMEELQKQKDELLAQLQRVSADYVNFQKRTPRQVADAVGYEKEKIIRTLLPVLDGFEHTLQSAAVASAENAESFVRGIKIVHDQMLDVLKSHGVEQIKSLGEKFDPTLHEAIMQKSVNGAAENIVVEEFQKGYKINDRVMRPSRVIVSMSPVRELPAEGAQQPERQGEEFESTDLE